MFGSPETSISNWDIFWKDFAQNYIKNADVRLIYRLIQNNWQWENVDSSTYLHAVETYEIGFETPSKKWADKKKTNLFCMFLKSI